MNGGRKTRVGQRKGKRGREGRGRNKREEEGQNVITVTIKRKRNGETRKSCREERKYRDMQEWEKNVEKSEYRKKER